MIPSPFSNKKLLSLDQKSPIQPWLLSFALRWLTKWCSSNGFVERAIETWITTTVTTIYVPNYLLPHLPKLKQNPVLQWRPLWCHNCVGVDVKSGDDAVVSFCLPSLLFGLCTLTAQAPNLNKGVVKLQSITTAPTGTNVNKNISSASKQLQRSFKVGKTEMRTIEPSAGHQLIRLRSVVPEIPLGRFGLYRRENRGCRP